MIAEAVARKQAKALRALARLIELNYDGTGFLGIYMDKDGCFVLDGKVRSTSFEGAIFMLEERFKKQKRRAA